MTFNTNSDIISNLLAMTADEVDVPGTMRTAAHEAYRSVGMHLQSQATPTAWDMYAQGSFETNTVVRPIVGSGGFVVIVSVNCAVAPAGLVAVQMQVEG